MAVCAAWPSLPFINATTDGSATLHKKHTVRLGGAPIEITIKLRTCLLVFPALLAWFGPPEKEE